MNFLTPLFLLGGLALAAPVIFHLIRRQTRDRVTFSSLMFLQPSPPRLAKRSRLEHLLLLLLRCAALLLLALGFSRPFFKETPLADPTSVPPTRTVVLLDVSASMRRTGLWSAAVERAQDLVRRAAPADQVALYTFDRTAAPLLGFEEWARTTASDRPALVASRLAATAPGWGGTQLGAALITAAEALAETEGKPSPGPRQIVLISDLQAGSRLDALQAYEWPKGVRLLLEPVKAAKPTNAGLQLLGDSADASRAAAAVVRVRVTNAADSQREQFKLGWARAAAAGGGSTEPVEPLIPVYVPPGQSRVVTVPVQKDAAGLDRIVLQGDDEEFDNTVFVIPPAQQRIGVVWLGGEAAADVRQPLFFLRRALADTPKLAVRILARSPSAPLLPTELAEAEVVFISEPLPSAGAAALRELALAGKTLVLAPKQADLGATFGALLGRALIGLTEVRPTNYAMLAEIDFQHPLFAPFADPRFSDFTKIHFWRYRKFDPAALPGLRVLAKFDSGDPAVAEVPLGKGRLVVLAAGWQPEDSQLAVSSKFVPLLWSLLDAGGTIGGAPVQWLVGDIAPLPAGAAEKEIRFTAPGIREVDVAGRPLRLAANIDANESRTAPLSADELERLGVPVASPVPAKVLSKEDKVLLQGVEAENRQKLWRWLLAATLVVLVIETIFAGRAARRLTLKTEETSP